MTCTEATKMLDAFIDSELEPGRQAEIQQHIAECPECRSRYESLAAIADQVRTAPQYSLSNEQKARLASSIPATSKRNFGFSGFFLGAASVAIIWIACAIFLRPHPGFETQLVTRHVESLAAGKLVSVVSTDRHTVKPWFAGKAPIAPMVIDFKDKGFPLLGGRIEKVENITMPVIVFGHGNHFIDLYVISRDSEVKIEQPSHNGFEIISWTHNDLQYIAIADTDRRELEKFADLYQRPATMP